MTNDCEAVRLRLECSFAISLLSYLDAITVAHVLHHKGRLFRFDFGGGGVRS
jgi:hypothetical protein